MSLIKDIISANKESIVDSIFDDELQAKVVKALNDNVQRFEKAHGTIKDYEQPPIPMNFGPTGEA